MANASKCLVVRYAWSPNAFRMGTASVITIAQPEKIAPATKYGAKIVACQPGTIATAKSQETTECTESTSGVASAAKKMYALLKWCHSRSVPRHPMEIIL